MWTQTTEHNLQTCLLLQPTAWYLAGGNGAKGEALGTCRLDEDEQSLFNYWINNINVWQEWNTKEFIVKLLMYVIILTWNHQNENTSMTTKTRNSKNISHLI